MTHVTETIAATIRDLVAAIPAFETRVFKAGAIGWDRETYPFAVVAAGSTAIATNQSGSGRRSGRLQDRRTVFAVEVHARRTSEADYVAEMAGLAVAVETALERVGGELPIDDLVITGDTGAEVEATETAGIHAIQTLTLAVTYHTIEGHPDAFVEPNR